MRSEVAVLIEHRVHGEDKDLEGGGDDGDDNGGVEGALGHGGLGD